MHFGHAHSSSPSEDVVKEALGSTRVGWAVWKDAIEEARELAGVDASSQPRPVLSNRGIVLDVE